MRVRGFPFHQDVVDFINAHDQVFIVEQNRACPRYTCCW